MKKVLFICYGNICRSVSAEYIMKDLAKKNGVELYVSSAATSREEIGNDIYPPAKRKLKEKGIPFSRHYARQATMSDYLSYDYLICMDENNMRNLNRMFNNDPDHGSLTLAHSRNSQMSFMYGFFFVKFLFFAVVCVVIVI